MLRLRYDRADVVDGGELEEEEEGKRGNQKED